MGFPAFWRPASKTSSFTPLTAIRVGSGKSLGSNVAVMSLSCRPKPVSPRPVFCASVAGMRTDRLVAVLLLLQQREQVTAAEVAQELEVSERTARRDLDALTMAGVPVYSMQGRGGGWRLVGGARTDLSGLTASEARALFLVAGPASAATPAVKAALRKLVHALPEPFLGQAEAAASSLVMDPRRWGTSRAEHRRPRFLDELQDAVIRSVQVRLGYVDRE